MKSIHITQGRFNPVHAGHAMVVKHVMDAAKKEGADHKILTTGSHDAKKNPLTPEQKVKHLQRAVPGAHVEAMGKDHPTLLHQMSKLHKQGYTHVTMHVGSDRVKEFHDLLHRYNGKDLKHGHYNFKSIKVKSVGGERKEGGGGIESASGTAMRKHAAAGDKASFHKMAPAGMSTRHKDQLYHDVRKGMGVNEMYSRFKNWLLETVNVAGGGNVRGIGAITNADGTTTYASNNADEAQERNEILDLARKQSEILHNKPGKSK
jgi:hypothetical protein